MSSRILLKILIEKVKEGHSKDVQDSRCSTFAPLIQAEATEDKSSWGPHVRMLQGFMEKEAGGIRRSRHSSTLYCDHGNQSVVMQLRNTSRPCRILYARQCTERYVHQTPPSFARLRGQASGPLFCPSIFIPIPANTTVLVTKHWSLSPNLCNGSVQFCAWEGATVVKRPTLFIPCFT